MEQSSLFESAGAQDQRVSFAPFFDDWLVAARAALADGRINAPLPDLHRLSRTPIQRGDRPVDVTAKIDGGLRLEAMLRERLNDLRYLGREH